jgi:hypothetical protein
VKGRRFFNRYRGCPMALAPPGNVRGFSGPCCSCQPGFHFQVPGAAVRGVTRPREFCTGARRPRATRVHAIDEQFCQ